ncbi:hypothetical protein JA1_000791 [Spathaspora sp. JA1]|nr:hypothetical protein JA1_000791 [Spathaspora sp. JA1]
MILEETSFQGLQGIYVDPKYQSKSDEDSPISQDIVYTFMLELVNMNFVLDKPVIDELCKLSAVEGGEFLKQHLALIKRHLGDHVKHEPFYPNFPAQVMNTSNLDLFINAIIHYFTWGTWRPIFIEEKRVELSEDSTLVRLRLVGLDELKQYFIKLICSKTGIPIIYDGFIKQGINQDWFDIYKAQFSEIQFRETSCKLAVECLKQGKDVSFFVKTTTDILRIMAVYSKQPSTLKRVGKFKSMKRKERRILIQLLENVISIEDVKRHRSIWIRAFHCLHVGEYKGKVNEIAAKFRNENNVYTKNTVLCQAIEKGETESAVGILKNLPSMFARYLDKLLRDCIDGSYEKTLKEFTNIAQSVESKILLQALGHFKGNSKTTNRSVFADQKLILINKKKNQNILSNAVANKVVNTIRGALIEKYKTRNHFGENSKVYISKEVEGILLPMQLNTGNDSNKRAIARGSRIILDACDSEKNIIRFFIHWIGLIIDLGAVFLKEDLETSRFINYTHLKEEYAVHSGDIIYAPGPKGASEFIDIDINKALDAGYRYAQMDVRVYQGPTFAKHEECFGGYMMRQEQQEGEIFETSTVRSKMDFKSETRTISPFMFDLNTREVIWLDVPTTPKVYLWNDLNHNINATKETLKAYLELPLIKVNMKELVELHVEAAGGSATIVESREDANFIVGLGEGDLDVYDFATINSNWI